MHIQRCELKELQENCRDYRRHYVSQRDTTARQIKTGSYPQLPVDPAKNWQQKKCLERVKAAGVMLTT